MSSSKTHGNARDLLTRSLPLIGLSFALLSASCSVSSMPDASGQSSNPTSTSSDGQMTRSAADLLTRSSYDPSINILLTEVFESRIAQCMRSKGLTYEPATLKNRGPLTDGVDLGTRSADGYGFWSQYSQKLGDAPRERLLASMSRVEQERWSTAVGGDLKVPGRLKLVTGGAISYPTTGCQAAARRELGGGDLGKFVELTYQPGSLRTLISKSIEKDQSFNSRINSWSLCMRKAGLEYETPLAARRKLEAAYDLHGPTGELRKQEVRVAEQDGRCAISVGLSRLQQSLVVKYANLLPQENILKINDLAEFEKTVMVRAEALR
jgi:hypothetical protein